MAHVLIVDDDRQILKLLREVMEREGHGVMVAENGLSAGRLFRENAADLVITDLLMPHKEGLELIEELRSLSASVKIIAYTGGGHLQPDEYLKFARGLGADRVFPKPIPIQELRAAVSELLAAR